MAKTSKKDEVAPVIIIKKVKKVSGGHHGGAWKVAYADFVTAMMAFFLLLWLLNVVTSDALQTISNYFDPSHPRISEMTSGAGGIMGGLSTASEGAQVTDVQPLTQTSPTGMGGRGTARETGEHTPTYSPAQAEIQRLEEELRRQEEARFSEAKKQLEDEIRKNPALAELAKNMMVDITEEGLRIQIFDQDGRPLFPLGRAEMYDYTKTLIGTVADVVKGMPNDISIRGHTDGYKYAPGATYTNWELSADRANASRRQLLASGVAESKMENVMGQADREHMVPENPLDARNRRISIILMREKLEQAMERGAFGDKAKLPPAPLRPGTGASKPPASFQKTPGSVYFP